MIEYPIYHINKGARKLKVVPDPPEITAYFVSVGHKPHEMRVVFSKIKKRTKNKQKFY